MERKTEERQGRGSDTMRKKDEERNGMERKGKERKDKGK